ncbi:MAG: sensor histidine kinase [Actinomycetota bacterium]
MDRRDRLIRSGLTLASELSLEAVLQRIVEAASELTDAQYGALGVLGPDGRITQFVTTGVTPEQRAAIGDLPTGHGILGLLIAEARPVRLPNLGDHPLSYGFPANHPPMTSFLGAPVSARGTVYGNLYLTNKRSAPEFDEEDEEALVILATQAGIAVENARLYEESQARQRWLAASAEIANAILSRARPDETIGLIAARAREIVRADLAWIVTPEGPGQLRVTHADGERAASIIGMTIPSEGSTAGIVLRTGSAVMLQGPEHRDRGYRPLIEAGNVGPAIYAPLTVNGRAFGSLAAAHEPGGRFFDDEALRLLETFADQAAIALDYARVQHEVERLAILEDRERIAKELHDGVIQALFAVGMGLQGTALMSGDEELERRIEGAVGELDRVIRDLRNYIFGLRPGILADRQLDKALRAIVDDFQNKSGIVTIIELDETVASELSTIAGDVVQLTREALSNVGRHSGAATCRVSLLQHDGVALLEVDDDGSGFDPETVRRGDGLTNLEQRATALGGSAAIESVPTQGTTVRIRLPL